MLSLFKPVQSFEDITRNFEQIETAGTPVWKPLAYSANYADVGGTEQPGQWWKDAAGFINLRGTLKKTVAWVNAETMFTLPAGARPGKNERFPVLAIDHTAGTFAAAVNVQSSGVCSLVDWTPAVGAPAALDFLFLGSIRFQQVN